MNFYNEEKVEKFWLVSYLSRDARWTQREMIKLLKKRKSFYFLSVNTKLVNRW